MSVLQVLHIPDERLRKVAKPVEEVNAIGHVNKDSRQLNILGERENEQVFIAAFNCLRLKFSSPVQEGVLYGTGVFSVAELRLFICHSKC